MPSHQRSIPLAPSGLAATQQLLAGPSAQAWQLKMQQAAAPQTGMLDRGIGLAAIIALHLAAGFALLVMVKPGILPTSTSEVRIQLLPVTGEATPAAEPSKPKPLPVAPQRVEQPRQERQTPRPQPTPRPEPILAAPSTAPSATATAAAPKEAPAPVETPPAQATAPSAASTTGKTDTVATQPARFDAAYLSNPEPPYPRASKTLREQGKVFLRVQVSAEGRPLQVLIDKSSGFPRLDQSAQDTVQSRWRFVPARQGQQAVEGWVVVPVSFTLTS